MSTLNGLMTLWNMYLLFHWSYSVEIFVDSEVSRVEIEPYRREKLFNTTGFTQSVEYITMSFFFFPRREFPVLSFCLSAVMAASSLLIICLRFPLENTEMSE